MAKGRPREDARHIPNRPDPQRDEHGPEASETPAAPDPISVAPPELLTQRRLDGRGNAPARVALLHGLQQTHGNRATQRLLHTGSAPLAIQRDTVTAEPETQTPQRHSGQTYRLTYAAAVSLSEPAWQVTLVIANAPERAGGDIRDARFEAYVDACMSSIRAVLRAAGARSADRRVRVDLRYRRGDGEVDASTAADAATKHALGLDAPPPADAPPEAAPEPSPLRIAAAERYKAVAAREREEGKREFANRETWKVKNVEDRARFLESADYQHAPRFIAEVYEERAAQVLKGADYPVGDQQRLFENVGLRADGYARARRASEQEYPIYLARARKYKIQIPGQADITNAAVSWAAEWADWRQSVPHEAGLKAEQSDLRDQFGSVRGDLLAAETQSNAMRGEAAKLVLDLAEVVSRWGKASAAVITVTAPGFWAAPNAGRDGVAAAVQSFGYALYQLGRASGADQRDPDPAHWMTDAIAQLYGENLDRIFAAATDLPAQIKAARTPIDWGGILARFQKLGRDMDSFIEARLRAEQQKARPGPDGATDGAMGRAADQLAHAGAKTAGLRDLAKDHPEAQRIPAVFYPMNEWENAGEAGAPQFQARGIPWVFYLYRAKGEGAEAVRRMTGAYVWTLVDMTSPRQEKANTAASADDKAPPAALFEEVNSKLRFPRGELWLQMPDGAQRSVQTTEPWRLSEFLTYIGLAAGAVALGLATFGASVPTSILVIGGVATAAGAAADMVEKSQQGMLTSKDILVDVLTIVSGLASAEEALGQFFVSESLRTGKFAQLAALHGRWKAPVHLAGVGANLASFAILSDDTWTQYHELNKIADPQERALARARLVSNFLLSGALTIISIREEIAARQAGKDLRLTRETVTDTPGESAPPGHEPPEQAPGAEGPTPKVNYFPGEGDPVPAGPTPPARALNPADYTVTDVHGGANLGKKRLRDNATGREYIFKPASGEVPLVGYHEGIRPGQRYRRGAAAGVVADELGIGGPHTEVVMFGNELGSLQEWVPNGVTLGEIAATNPDLYNRIMNSQLKRDMDMFDYLVGNLDRGANLGNLMVELDPVTGELARLVPIDTDVVFPPSPLRYTLDPAPRMRAGQTPLPPRISTAMVDNLRHMGANREALTHTLGVYLNEPEIQGMMRRLDEILAEVDTGGIRVQ